MMNFTFTHRQTYSIHVDADEWISRLNNLLQEPEQDLFDFNLTNNRFRGHRQGYTFLIQREFGSDSRLSGLLIEGSVDPEQRTVTVNYQPNRRLLSLSLFLFIVMFLVGVWRAKSSSYLSLLLPVAVYVVQLIRFNYELSLATSLIIRLCRLKRP